MRSRDGGKKEQYVMQQGVAQCLNGRVYCTASTYCVSPLHLSFLIYCKSSTICFSPLHTVRVSFLSFTVHIWDAEVKERICRVAGDFPIG